MIQRDSSETVCVGQAVFYVYAGDIELEGYGNAEFENS